MDKKPIRYRNIHTGEIWTLQMVHIVLNEKPIRIFEFDNGEKISQEIIEKHWEKIE